MTDEERALVYDLGQIWNRICNVVGDGPTRDADLAEMIPHIHALQRNIMAQAASRMYPGEFRTLGESLELHG